MNRRSFLTSMIGGVATAAAVRTWPFRVYSFPSEIIIVKPLPAEAASVLYRVASRSNTWIPMSAALYSARSKRFQARTTDIKIFTEEDLKNSTGETKYWRGAIVV